MLVGMTLLGKGVRATCEPEATPVKGLEMGKETLAVLRRGSAKKSPCRSAAVGTVVAYTGFPVSSGDVAGSESLMPSKPKNQKTRFLPLKTLGIHSGPPTVTPYWL